MNDKQLLKKEFNIFLNRIGKTVVETRKFPEDPRHRFTAPQSLCDIISQEEAEKWRIGRTIMRVLKEYDKMLLDVIKENKKYDFRGSIFVCWVEEENVVCFEMLDPRNCDWVS